MTSGEGLTSGGEYTSSESSLVQGAVVVGRVWGEVPAGLHEHQGEGLGWGRAG